VHRDFIAVRMVFKWAWGLHPERTGETELPAGTVAQLAAARVAASAQMKAAKQAETNEKGARRTYAVAQGLAIADVTIKTVQAAMAAYASLAAFPPAAAAVASMIGAMGAMQVAKIASTQPSFHVGGVFSPDEGSANLRRGEGVLTTETTRNMGGEAGIAALNRSRGAGMGATRVVIDWQDGAKGLTRTMQRLRKQNGNTLNDLDRRAYSGRSWDR
jgi:hypothetical protein